MSLRTRAWNLFLRLSLKPMLAAPLPITTIRKWLKYSSRLTLIAPKGVAFEVDPSAGAAPALAWVRLGQPRDDAVLLFLHGGAFCFGEPGIYTAMLARLSRDAGLPVCAPAYRLAPEHRFPAQIEDALASWDALRARGYAARRIVIAGDSAGGGLALSLTAELLKRGQVPAGVVAMSPWTDLTFSGASWIENRFSEVVLPARMRRQAVAMVTGGDPAVARDPRMSPLFADFNGGPPTLIHYSTSEVLRDDGAEMARRLRAMGVEVIEDARPGLPHVWQTYDPWLIEAGQALDQAAAFMRRQLSDRSDES